MKKSALLLFIFLSAVLFGENNYKRVISISPALTEEVFLLGSGDRLIADTTFCTRPEAAKNIEKIGTIVEINIEKIISLKPDLVMTTTMTRKEKIDKLIKLGIKVEVFYEPDSFTMICRDFKRVAVFLNKEKEADAIISASVNKVDRITYLSKNLEAKKIFIEISSNPLFTITGNSYLNDFIKYCHAINISGNTGAGLYSMEKVIELNPDIIIITDMGINIKDEINVWKRFQSINAVKNNRIFTIDSYLVCSSNPVTFAEALSRFMKIIHPEINYKEYDYE